jgi:predicted type IV restriction endonuclease
MPVQPSGWFYRPQFLASMNKVMRYNTWAHIGTGAKPYWFQGPFGGAVFDALPAASRRRGLESTQNVLKPDSAKPFEEVKGAAGEEKQRMAVETTQEELDFFALIRDICAKGGTNPEEILYRDTTAYFNISYRRPTKWFLRFFSNAKRKSVVTWVPTAEAKQLVSGFVIEDAPVALGLSRVYLENIAQIWALKALVLRSLDLSKVSKEEAPGEAAALPASPLKEIASA